MKEIIFVLLIIFLLSASLSLVSARKTVSSGGPVLDRAKPPLPVAAGSPKANATPRKGSSLSGPGSSAPQTITLLPKTASGPTNSKAPILSREEIEKREKAIEGVNRTVPLAQGELWNEIPPPNSPPTKPVLLNPVFQGNSLPNDAEEIQALGPNDLRYQIVHDLTLSETGTPGMVNEPSVGNIGDTVFLTGNWYAARSTDKGRTFQYVSPTNTFPQSNDGFCCDQIVNYGPQQDMMIWALQYIDDGNTNTLRIARAIGSSEVNQNRWTYYNLNPQQFGFPNGTWFDFPNLTISSTYLYITSNVFLHDGPYTGSVLVRYSLAELAAGAVLHGEYFPQTRSQTDVGGLRCTEGAGLTMFCAGHRNSSQVRIFRWDDGTGAPILSDDVSLDPYTAISCDPNTGECDGVAIGPDGSNWAARADGRILGAWVSQGVIGLMWAARQDATFPYPYTIVARFDQTTRNKISQTPIWSPDTAFLYPSVAVNSSRNLAGLISYGGGLYTPGSNLWIADDIESGFSPLNIYGAAPGSTNGPNTDKWGDYQTVRRHKDFTNTWVAATFRLQGGPTQSDIVPRYIWFGRVRDLPAPQSGSANLVPYRPADWDNSIVLSNISGTTSDSSSFTTGREIYVDWAVINSGNTWTETKFYLNLLVDGQQRGSWYSAAVLPNNYVYINDFSIGRLSAGSHTIKIVADPTNAITESNESDNEFSRTINVIAGPANDNFINAQAITGTSGAATGSNVNAAKETGEPNHAANAGGASVWYQWQAPANGVVVMSTAGSNFDTLLAAYNGSNVSGLTPIASNDDENYPSVLTSKITFNTVAGAVYRIAVDGWSGTSGNITLSYSQTQATSATVQFSASSASVTEVLNQTTKVDFVLTRAGATSGAASVTYATVTGSATDRSDYLAALGTAQFAVGQTSTTISVFIVDDRFGESPETLTVALSNPVGCTVGAPSVFTVTIISNESVNGVNPVKDATFSSDFFVREHYVDFFNRAPDSGGLAFWKDQIDSCTTQACREIRRINVSAAFFVSIEFQQTGYLVERLYKTAYGSALGTSTLGGTHQISVPVVRLNEFLPDTQQIGRGVVIGAPGAEQLLESNKQALIADFVQRSRFLTAFPISMTPAQFVDTLNANAGGVLSSPERNQLVNDLTSGAKTRAQVLRAVAEDSDLFNAETNRAFVLAQFFGYLRRNPNDSPDSDYTGYDFWLGKLNQFNGNFVAAEMVKAFIVSGEYQQRFGP
jgi:hypothetical protein